MHRPTFKTVPEVLLYTILLGVLVLNVIGLIFTLQQQKTIAENSKIRTAQIEDLKQHVDCISNFFNTQNRTTLVLDSVCSDTN